MEELVFIILVGGYALLLIGYVIYHGIKHFNGWLRNKKTNEEPKDIATFDYYLVNTSDNTTTNKNKGVNENENY